MKTRFLLAGVVAASAAVLVNPPDARAEAPTTMPAGQTAADTASLRLRLLQPVLDAHERRQDWHQAADAAAARVDSEPLRKELTQRLAGLAPRVAKALSARPHDDALVTVAVYREQGLEGKQAMVAVTFDGMGSDIGSNLFSAILADLPNPPQAKGAAGKLVLDQLATSYLVFFLDREGLSASDVPHDKMKQGVMLAINRQHEEAARSELAARQQNQAAAGAAANQQSPDLSRAQQASGSQAPGGPYPTGAGYTYPIPEIVNDGYGYPGVGVPIVILPSGTVAQPSNNQGNGMQPHGTQESNQKRQPFPAPGQPGGAPANGQQAGTNPPAGSSGVNQPSGSAGVRQPAGSAGVNPPPARSGQANSSSSAERPERPPPPPAQREAPRSGSTGGSPPAQGRAPAQNGGQAPAK